MHSHANTQAIRAGAHRFGAAAQAMRENGHRLQLQATALIQGSDSWRGEGADAFLTVAEHLNADAVLAGEAFGRAAGALMSLAGQLDEVNSLRHQAESLEGQMYALQRDLAGADGAQLASIHDQLSHLRHRHTTLLHQADVLQYQANVSAETAFDDIGALTNRLSFQHGQTAAASAMDKVGDFFGSLWKGAKEAVETIEDTASGLAAGIDHFVQDTVKTVWEMSPAHFIVELVTNYDEVRSKAARIFQDLQHPVDAIRRNFAELPSTVTVIGHGIVDSWNRDIVNGNAYSRSEWVGYALGMVALGVLTDGASTLAGFDVKAAGVETKLAQVVSHEVEAPFESAIQHTALDFTDRFTAEQWGNQHYGNWTNALLPHEYQAVEAYTGDHYYNMNAVLRGFESEYEGENHKYVEWLSEALSKTPVPEDVRVYRGTSQAFLGSHQALDPAKLVGQFIGDKGFMSTSLVSTGAFDGDLLLVIDVPKGTNAAYVGHISQYQQEVELLLDKGYEMQIVDVQSGAGPTKLFCRIIRRK